MDNQAKNFINLISAYIKGEKPELAHPNWREIERIAAIHNLSAMVYLSVKDADICDDKEVIKQLEQSFNYTVRYSVQQEVLAEYLIKLLNENKIRHILFKGFVLREYYPNKEIRTMGDIDIIIDPDNQKAVHKVLLDNGFSYDELASHSKVRNYSKNGVCFEIHTQAVEKNIFDDVSIVEYFSDSFKYADLINGYSYAFNKEHHLIYLLEHTARHFKDSGCGVRMLLDLFVFIRRFGDDFDWVYVKNELNTLKLLDFAANIFALCNAWFGMEMFFDCSIDKQKEDILTDYIVKGGVFGYEGRNTDAIRINTSGVSVFKRIINISKLIFPSADSLKQRYVWAENMPKWLLPLGWIRLWWFRVVKNRENSLRRIKLALSNNDDALEHTKLIDLIGLN